MKTIIEVKGVLTEKGLELETKELKVLSKNEVAMVLDTKEYKTVLFKNKIKGFKDCLGENKLTEYTVHILEVTGYYKDEETAKERVKQRVFKYLKDKSRQFQELAELVKVAE